MLSLYSAILLGAAVLLPWWRMESRAPQYGMRVLWVNVSPTGIDGDVKEIDGLGHYVGMQPMVSMAKLERAGAPFAVGFVVLCALALPFLQPGWRRGLAAGLVIAVPFGFVADLWFWQQYAVKHLDPTASLNMIADRVQTRLVGKYSVAQFKVHATFQAGFWLVVVAAANALGFLFCERSRECRAGAKQRASSGALGAAALLMIPPIPIESLHVGPESQYATVGAAVAVAAAGDEIVVHAGTYRELVVLDRPLVLRGEEGAVIDGSGEGTVVLVRAGPSTVAGLTIRGSGASLLGEDSGVKLLDTSDCTVEDNRIEDTLFGILARSSPRSRLIGNHVTGKELPIPRQGDGIRLQNAADSVVEDNVVERSRDLAIWQSHGCVTRRNVVRGGRYGLHYMYSDDNLFEDNLFEGNQTGGAIMYSRRVTLRRNRFKGSRGPSAYGLLIKVGDDVLAECNWFVDNSSGIFLEDTPSSLRCACTFRKNVIAGNDTGITVQPSVSRVLFTENVIVSNRRPVQALGRTRSELNVWSAAGRGNYWDDYVGFDADGDGVGDTPYRLEAFFEDLTDRWPAVGLLRMGPASEALETAARAFPIVQPRPVLTDEHPLVRPPSGLAPELATRRQPGLVAAGLLVALSSLFILLRSRSAFGGAS
ncbi:MAG: nitrous oxide reductase family maturation protein NosD [bacterium]|nr:nitrous oxide reductase family maturation protein NosD [bacterium]